MIPSWNHEHVLPPVRPEQPGHSTDRSPYKVSLVQVVEHFALTQERIIILEGLLAYRKELHNIGLVAGFQWLDGSFMEHVEESEDRPPNDVDVVTFAYLPKGETQTTLMNTANQDLFVPNKTKAMFKVDAYFVEWGLPITVDAVGSISYWYSMWSHRRNDMWKGFIQVKLLPDEDKKAKLLLEQMKKEQNYARA